MFNKHDDNKEGRLTNILFFFFRRLFQKINTTIFIIKYSFIVIS